VATKKPKTILFRRKRECKTDYNKRLKLLLSQKPRLVVRFTNQKIIAQIIKFSSNGDKILAATDSSILKKYGWTYSTKNLPAAYLTGLIIAKLAQSKDCTECILDTGFKQAIKKGKVYAFLKGAVDAGLNVPYGNEDIFPTEEAINGKLIEKYAALLKENQELYQKKFTKYIKTNSMPENMSNAFSEAKEKINK
jgi:large subunit ribosomal protein L18